MGRVMRTGLALMMSAAGRSGRKRELKRINKANERSRGIRDLGTVSESVMLPASGQLGSTVISGGSADLRARLVTQCCRSSVQNGAAVIVLHEGDSQLASLLQRSFYGHSYLRSADASQPCYDPIFRLSGADAAQRICEASPKEHPIPPEGALYIRALADFLRKQGIVPYTRMFGSCPHDRINTELAKLEQAGRISAADADSIRNGLNAGTAGIKASVIYFFSSLMKEADILPWKNGISRSTSAAECVRCGGILLIDVTSFSRKALISLITAELRGCAASGRDMRIVCDAASLAGCEPLTALMQACSPTVCFTVSTPDISAMSGSKNDSLAPWLALSHRVILFSHGQHASTLLSSELGEYDRINVTDTLTGNNGLGMMGYHYNGAAGLTTSMARDKVVRPEELGALGEGEFIMLDNRTAELFKGTLK